MYGGKTKKTLLQILPLSPQSWGTIRFLWFLFLNSIQGEILLDTYIETLKDVTRTLLDRQEAIIMLVTSGEIAALEPLMQALKDENQEIRKDAAMALGRFGDVRAIASLVDALKDTYVYVRFEAAIALGYIKDIRSVKPLVKAFTGALKNGDDTLLYAAINSLVKLGDLSVSALSQAFNAEDIMLCNWIIPTLARIYSSRALEALINLLKDENNDLWLHIIIYLIDFEDELVLSTLTRLYETSSNKVIIRAVSDAIKFLQTGEKVDLQQYLRPQTS